MDKSFPIVFATDDNYLVPTYVAISSLLRHINKNTDIKIFIVSSDINEENRQYFYELSDKIFFIEPPVDYNSDNCHLNKKLSYISKATYYRLYIPSMLSEYDKCLYLDSDIVVKGDITPLISLPIEDLMLIGTRNYFSKEHDRDFYKARCFDCALPDLDHYVNAGVLMMNLAKLREDGMQKALTNDTSNAEYDYNDQDILNKHCVGQIGLVGVKYNFMVQYLKDLMPASVALGENILKAADDPVIVHYSTKKKPWACKGYLMADLWDEEVRAVESKEAKRYFVKPFIKQARKGRSVKEKIFDEFKLILRKWIFKDFKFTTQRRNKS